MKRRLLKRAKTETAKSGHYQAAKTPRQLQKKKTQENGPFQK